MRKLLTIALAAVVIMTLASSCKKETNSPNGDNGNTGTHNVDPRLVGKWMWTKGSDLANYDDNGVYTGSAYGFAMQYNISANGSGTCFNHVYSTLDGVTGLEVNISYNGFFESDDQGHLGFFPTSGTYKSSSGTNRALRSDELWDSQTHTGRSILSQKLVFTTQGGRECFQVTASDGTVDTYFKVP